MREKRFIGVMLSISICVSLVSNAGAFWWDRNEPEEIDISISASVPVTFTRDDFITANVKEELTGVVIEELPDVSVGFLSLNGRTLLKGEALSVNSIEKIVFVPTGQETQTTMKFFPVFNDTTDGRNPVAITIGGEKEKSGKPSVSDSQAITYMGVPIECDLSAVNAYNNKVFFKIVDAPQKGRAEVKLNKVKYTPDEGKKGKDSFLYVAIDTMGNMSDPGQITVDVQKSRSCINYVDMKDNPGHYAAIKLHEMDILTGEKIGDTFFMNPDRQVTRNEFIAMALTACGIPLQEAMPTHFADDGQIVSWARPYVYTAAVNGIVIGYPSDCSNPTFEGENYITTAEAAVILNKLAFDSDITQTIYAKDASDVPTWAMGATVNLAVSNIIKPNEEGKINPNEGLTRDTACQLIADTVRHIESK